jgi:hypothetical protein
VLNLVGNVELAGGSDCATILPSREVQLAGDDNTGRHSNVRTTHRSVRRRRPRTPNDIKGLKERQIC